MRLPHFRPAALFVSLFLTVSPLSAQSKYQAVLFTGASATPEQRLMAMTLAGIVNRDSARLYLYNVYETWSYTLTDELWQGLYQQRGNVQFEVIADVGALVNRFRSFINGGIQYDPARVYSNFTGQSFRWQAEYASLIGALTNRLPVTASMAASLSLTLEDSILINDSFNGDSPVWAPGRLDAPSLTWNNGSLTEEQRYLTMLDWSVTNLLPLCNPSSFYLREITDFAVQRKMFQMNLAGTSDLDFFSLSDEKASLIERALTYLHAHNPVSVFHIYGWMRPEPLTQWFAFFGASFHETLLSNLSWHSSFPLAEQTFVLKSAVSYDTVEVKDKHYLLFIGSEGDASNWQFSFQSGAWQSPKRGEVPIGWGWNLHLLGLSPFVAKYYYDTATPNNGFVAVTSPLGYAYPDLWQSDVWHGAVDSSRALMQKFGVQEVYAYKHYSGTGTTNYRGKVISNSFNFPRLALFQNDIGALITMVYDPAVQTQTPLNHNSALLFNHVTASGYESSFYADVSNLDTAAARIIRNVKRNPSPSFLIAGYQRLRQDDFLSRVSPASSDISVQRLVQLAALLKANPEVGSKIEIVTPQYFSALMRKCLGMTGVAEPSPRAIPEKFALTAYPNPFNSQTTIEFSLAEPAELNLEISDILGRRVAIIPMPNLNGGVHRVSWNADNISSGMYFARLIPLGASGVNTLHSTGIALRLLLLK